MTQVNNSIKHNKHKYSEKVRNCYGDLGNEELKLDWKKGFMKEVII